MRPESQELVQTTPRVFFETTSPRSRLLTKCKYEKYFKQSLDSIMKLCYYIYAIKSRNARKNERRN